MADALARAWDDAARDWIRWARAPDHDHFFWRFVRPRLLELLPEPGRLTVDLGCGEGRLARELHGLGHNVLGIEPSPRLAAAAEEAEPSTRVVVAEAAALPLADGEADLVVSCMSLLNIADLDGALREVARVLAPGGRFAFVTTHPFSTLAGARHVLGGGSYFDELRFEERRERDGLGMTFHDTHRPFRALTAAVLGAGLLLEELDEPVPDADYVAAHPEAERWRSDPTLLAGRARKPLA